jgi:hypothetical protein
LVLWREQERRKQLRLSCGGLARCSLDKLDAVSGFFC